MCEVEWYVLVSQQCGKTLTTDSKKLEDQNFHDDIKGRKH